MVVTKLTVLCIYIYKWMEQPLDDAQILGLLFRDLKAVAYFS